MSSTDERAGKFFHGFADTFDSLYDGRRGPIWRLIDSTFRRDIVERFRLTFDRLGDLHGKTVLDIGCGSGVYMREALARGAKRVIGVDAAPRMLELAKQRLDAAGHRDGFELLEGNFPLDGVPQADCAIVMGVMDYVADPIRFLTALKGQLGGGLAAISFPSRHWLRSPLREVRYKLRNCPIYLYERRDLDRLLADCSLTAVHVEKIRGAGQDFHVVCR